MKDSGQEIDEANLRLNLWLTQGLVLAIAAGSSLFFLGWERTVRLFAAPDGSGLAMALLIALGIILASVAMDRYLPSSWQDDGNVNETVFGNMSPFMTLLVCISVGVGEEWLFRGVVQSWVGNLWTSIIFTLIHVRYLKKPLLFISVFVTSLLLGMLYEREGTLWPSIIAHILIDLVLAYYLQFTLNGRKGKKQ